MSSSKSSDSEPEGGKLVVCIDFGMTGTGCSYGRTWGKPLPRDSIPSIVDSVSSWPHADSYQKPDVDKAPTQIAYSTNRRGGDNVHWGRRAVGAPHAIKWFKSLLLNPDGLHNQLSEAPRQTEEADHTIRRLGKDVTVVAVVGDFLARVWDWAREHIRAKEFKGYYTETVPIHFVFTVPAVWEDYSRERMERAIEWSGVLEDDRRRLGGAAGTTGKTRHTHELVSEPECAAVYYMLSYQPRKTMWKKGDIITVLDLGGATGDIISLEVVEIEPNLELREFVPGAGDLCGATYADEAFEQLLKEKVDTMAQEKKMAKFQAWNAIPLAERLEALQYWDDKVKPNFRHGTGNFSVPLTQKQRNYKIAIKEHEIRDKVFDGVYGKIKALVDGHLELALLLAGGFGMSPHIKERLLLDSNRKYDDDDDDEVEILQESQGGFAIQAVMRGGVIMGLRGQRQQAYIKSRSSRYSYGWMQNEVFEEGVHHPDDKYWCGIRGRYMAGGQIVWFIKRGEQVDAEKSKRYPFRIPVRPSAPLSDLDEPYVVKIFRSESADPPRRLKENMGKAEDGDGKPWARDGFQEYGALKISYPNPDAMELVAGDDDDDDEGGSGSSGEPYLAFDYEVGVAVSGAAMTMRATLTDGDGREQLLGKFSVAT
ncbi:hypothetical protein GGR56DRAFT_681783 [Xylariaceae sp. FL0804]|nr:hypothetical protein GGR56DRAFT_681783 [Xylariaceae sp. FL0804]